ncbi:MAG: PspA/IM30 family protein [Pseudomonadota bacterium]|nr:PspA/IM30 family protein [Pseudomonadota bacterium]
MTVIKKLVTLLRGSTRELGQSLVDANATRIYEQEIIDAKASVSEAKTELTGVMAKEKQSVREIERIQADIRRYEDMAVQALDKANEPLALEVAERVAALEGELAEQTQAHTAYAVQVNRLKDLIRAAEARVREHEREIGIAKTTESVYRATQKISDSMGASGSKLVTARESLERIKQRHDELADRMAAADELDQEFGHRALERKLADAGIGDNPKARAADVMARIRARQAAAPALPAPKPDTP